MSGALESGDEGPHTLSFCTKTMQDLLIKNLCFFHSLVYRGQYY